jgi:uncharacterized protein (DUF2237 family)
MEKNVFGENLATCSTEPLTGFYRNGCCQTGPEDLGSHTVCAQVTEAFLSFSKSKGNDLTTPIPAYNFAGLKPGDFWCLCVNRWKEAYQAGKAPKVKLEATHENALQVVPMETLLKFACKTKP